MGGCYERGVKCGAGSINTIEVERRLTGADSIPVIAIPKRARVGRMLIN